ncbi:MAG: diguanylate cyclase [Defluviitaleaceae bacterium]|nr:diguanylate cyclase [Defluviitaleaceae bacterium]
MKKRLHFGVMFSTMDNANQYELWRGIDSFAQENDIHLTAYIGTYQVAGGEVTSFLDTCFETAAASDFLDGIIVMSGFLAQIVGTENFQKYIEKLPKDMPVVSASLPIEGAPCVSADSLGGVYDTVSHLIERHGKKQIAFVKGTEGHPEAEARLNGYKRALADNGISFDENYILPGKFNWESGEAAVATLIDERKLPFDAVVASNDQMAVGVLIELKRRGIFVPTDVAVTGFDDDVTSESLIPSLSTARQDFFEIGRECAKTLLLMTRGEAVDDMFHVKPEFIPRQSCGCLEAEYAKSAEILGTGTTLRNFIVEHFTAIFTNIPEGNRAEQTASWADTLVGAIGKTPFSQEEFLYSFNEILIRYNYQHKEIMRWHTALDVLSGGIEFHSYEVESLPAAHSALLSATAFVQDIRAKEKRDKDLLDQSTRNLVRRLASELVLTFDMTTLVNKLSATLPARELSLQTALIGVYRRPIRPGDTARLPHLKNRSDAAEGANALPDRTIATLFGFDDREIFNIQHHKILFSRYPAFENFDMERVRRSMFFIPLFFEAEELGVLLLPYGGDILIDTYDTLRVSIAAAIKGTELLSTIRVLSITDELTVLLNRRGFFQLVGSRIAQLSRVPDVFAMVMFMDMDGLKEINDTYGHSEGDAAISAFANILKDSLRKDDIIGRIGGDEFVVFSSVKSAEDGNRVVQRIRDNLDEYNARGLHPYEVSTSIGSVLLSNISHKCFNEAMLYADSVLYEEKQRKRESGAARR